MCCGPWLNEVLQELKDAQTTKGTRRTIDNICSATFGGTGFDVSAYSFDKTTGKSASKYQCMLWYAQANGVACMCAYLCVCHASVFVYVWRVGGYLFSVLCNGSL